MTKKRYFEKMWEEEYYLFDSNTISESDFEEKLKYQGYKAFEDCMMGGEVVNRLNELHDENKQFKKQLKIYEKFLEYSDLDFDWTEFCTADECINEYKDCIDDEIDCKNCIYLEDIND